MPPRVATSSDDSPPEKKPKKGKKDKEIDDANPKTSEKKDRKGKKEKKSKKKKGDDIENDMEPLVRKDDDDDPDDESTGGGELSGMEDLVALTRGKRPSKKRPAAATSSNQVSKRPAKKNDTDDADNAGEKEARKTAIPLDHILRSLFDIHGLSANKRIGFCINKQMRVFERYTAFQAITPVKKNQEYLIPIALGQALPFQHLIEGIADEESRGTPDIGVSPAKFALNMLPEDGHTEEQMMVEPWDRNFGELGGEYPYPEFEEIGDMDPSRSPELEREDQSKTEEVGDMEPSHSPQLEREDHPQTTEIGGMDPSPSPELEREDQPKITGEIGTMAPSLSAEPEREDQPKITGEIGTMAPSLSAEPEREDQPKSTEEIGTRAPSLSAEPEGEDQPKTTEDIGTMDRSPSADPEREDQNPKTEDDVENLNQYGLR